MKTAKAIANIGELQANSLACQVNDRDKEIRTLRNLLDAANSRVLSLQKELALVRNRPDQGEIKKVG